MKLSYDEAGLPFAEIELVNGDKRIRISKALIDTGSATTIISVETAISLGFRLHLADELIRIRGVGGVEHVYERYLERVMLDIAELTNLKVHVGAMQYGFEIDAIVGMDVLEQIQAIVNFHDMTLTPVVQP